MFHILVADDDKNIRFYLEALLSSSGYTVSLAENGDRALEIMDREHIDLVLVDVMMPGIDGFEFATSVRELNADIPILFMTAKIMQMILPPC